MMEVVSVFPVVCSTRINSVRYVILMSTNIMNEFIETIKALRLNSGLD